METLDITKFARRMGFKYKDVAEKLGKTTSLIGQVARGASKISYENVVKLVEMGITSEELLGESLGKAFKKQCYEEYIKENRVDITLKNADVKSIVVAGLQKILDDVNSN